MQKELCIIYNFAQKYREGIFKLIEGSYDCHWVFGRNKTDIKGLDDDLLKDVMLVDNVQLAGPIYYQTKVLSLFRKYDSLLVLSELFCISTWMMLLLKTLFYRKKKVYLWSHGWYGREGMLKRWLKKRFFGMADAVLLYGFYAKEVALKQGYKRQNLYVIHNSLGYDKQVELRNSSLASDIYKKHFNNNLPVLLFIGRLTKVKHLDLLIEAVSILRDKGRHYNIVFVGDGEERQLLEDRVKELGLVDTTWFYGSSYSEEQNAPLIHNADLCVSPGNVGLTAMHTMVYGTPVLTHDNFPFQMPEFEAIRPQRTGGFFKYNDVESLANAIETWFNMPNYDRQQIRQYCYDEIDDNWTPQYQIEKIENIIH